MEKNFKWSVESFLQNLSQCLPLLFHFCSPSLALTTLWLHSSRCLFLSLPHFSFCQTTLHIVVQFIVQILLSTYCLNTWWLQLTSNISPLPQGKSLNSKPWWFVNIKRLWYSEEYIWCLSIPGTEVLKPLGSPEWWGVFVKLMKRLTWVSW